ncbi:MAG: hypothetical protein GX970_04210 [Phyllobacteriaceae bacterium]|nr:hypothetical protein [Phyllobacteriaceae bacterium]
MKYRARRPFWLPVLAGLTLGLSALPSVAQFEVLDAAQDRPGQATTPAEPTTAEVAPPVCGTQPLSIARMPWPSAALLAEIHARILTAEFGCEVRVVAGDMAATASSMGSTGQPAVAPEMWVNRVADLWNAAMDSQMVRSAAPSFVEATFEGWFMPSYLADTFTTAPTAAALAEALPLLQPDEKMRFISCPGDWACSIINRNLVAAHGLEALVEIVEPANRFEMDRLIAEAVNRRELFLFYYWQPNAVLAQLDFVPLDMGAYDESAAQCLARRVCEDAVPSAFAPDLVVIAVTERIFVNMPTIAGYFQRATLPLAEMDELLAQLNAGASTPEEVADRFVAEREDIWRSWVGAQP